MGSGVPWGGLTGENSPIKGSGSIVRAQEVFKKGRLRERERRGNERSQQSSDREFGVDRLGFTFSLKALKCLRQG